MYYGIKFCISFAHFTVTLHNYFPSNCLPHDSIFIDRQRESFVIPNRVESIKNFTINITEISLDIQDRNV